MRAVRNPVLEKVRLGNSRCFPSPTFPSSQLHTRYLLCLLCFTCTHRCQVRCSVTEARRQLYGYISTLTQNISQLHFQTQTQADCHHQVPGKTNPQLMGAQARCECSSSEEALCVQEPCDRAFPKWTYLRDTFWCL